jgi:xanthine dehydrogenase accessory factor
MVASPILPELLRAIETRKSVALVTVVIAKGEFAPKLGQKALFTPADILAGALDLGPLSLTIHADIRRVLEQGRSQMLTYADEDLGIFVEVQQRPATLIIVGAGHVAQPLAQLGKMIGFEVGVLDDRPQYANKQRFPTADRVIAAPLAETLGHWPIDANTHIVLVTRGHSHDVASLLEIIDSPARYIGMIGSKRRIKAVFELLEKEQGIPAEKFDRIYAPIGLDIGAETPAEIAICIIAEIINLYRKGRAESLSDALRRNRRLAIHPVRGGGKK